MYAKKLAALGGSLILVMSFQNCSSSTDISDYTNQSSSTPSETAFISSQTASFTADENTAQSISIVVTNGTVESIQWFKNDVLLSTSTTGTLSFASIKKSEEGNYRAKVFLASGNVLDSAIIAISVTAAPVVATYTDVGIVYGGQTYPIFFYNNVANDTNGQNAYCKYKLGSLAYRTAFNTDGTSRYNQRIMTSTSEANCNADPSRVAYVNGFCLHYNSRGYLGGTVASLTCKSF